MGVLCGLSLVSLAAGTHGTFLQRGVVAGVTITKYPFLKALNAAESVFGYCSDIVFSYNAARSEADLLQRRLAEVMQHASQRNELTSENRRLRGMIQFIRSQPELTLEPVEILESFKGILMIDQGATSGILESMCAITEDGVVGMVTEVGPLTANLVTLQNPDCKVSGMVARNRVRGIVQGSMSDLSEYATMRYVDMKDDVQLNDLVVTSPESVFPAGYPIGRVIAIHDEGGTLWKTADIGPAVDVYRLDEIFIIRQAAPVVFEAVPPSLEETVQSVAPAVPDKRPLQERYAP